MILFAVTLQIREGNGTPLQYSCLENPMDRGAWQAAVPGVARSQTRLRDFTFTFPFMHWRRKWQPTPVFLPGESQGRGSLMGCCLWGCTESDTTEATQQQQQQLFKYMVNMYFPVPQVQTKSCIILEKMEISMCFSFNRKINSFTEIYHF